MIINTKVATGTASATAALGSAPLFITKLVPMIAPETISGGQLAPIGNAPNQISSSVAPVMIPVLRSPRTNPTSGAMTIGLFHIVLPTPS